MQIRTLAYPIREGAYRRRKKTGDLRRPEMPCREILKTPPAFPLAGDHIESRVCKTPARRSIREIGRCASPFANASADKPPSLDGQIPPAQQCQKHRQKGLQNAIARNGETTEWRHRRPSQNANRSDRNEQWTLPGRTTTLQNRSNTSAKEYQPWTTQA
ncbi:hypothetical protein [Propionivibrio dicarboxylicus]|uniref:hypothetical protein n=1 Tax=Propionivibrio dicarboxylicus TaxID=83767 RepID=UPI00115FF480|nr:hypothetical protein [Propionivibrio dicarboxylicus]